MTNVVNLVPAAYHQRLREFEEDRTLSTFLTALDEIAPVTTQDDSAMRAWTKHVDTVQAEEPLIEVLEWIAKFRFMELGIPPSLQRDAASSVPKEILDEVGELGRVAGELTKEHDAELEGLRANNPIYGKFSGVLPFLRLSDSPWFDSIGNPAKVIASYIESLYPDDADYPQPVSVHQNWLSNFIVFYLITWAIEKEKTIPDSGFSQESISRIQDLRPFLPILLDRNFLFNDSESWGGNCNPEVVARALVYLPQGLFDSILRSVEWDIDTEVDFGGDTSEEDGSTPAVRIASAAIEIFEIVSVLPISHGNSVSRDLVPFCVRDRFDAVNFQRLPVMSWGLHSRWMLNALDGIDGEYVIPALVDAVGELTDGFPYDQDDLRNAVRRVVHKIGLLDPYSSTARFGYRDGGAIGDALWAMVQRVGLERSELSFVFLLPEDDVLGFGSGESAIGSLWLMEMGSMFPGMAPERSENFRHAVDSAFNEGFVGLGCALMAFYVPTQILAYGEKAAFDWSWLSASLDRCVYWDNEGIVRASAGAGVQLLDALADDEASKTVHQVNLSRFAEVGPSDPPIDKDALRRALVDLRVKDEERAEELLAKLIGDACLRWMADQDRKRLKELVKHTTLAREEGQIVSGSAMPEMLLGHWFKFFENGLVRVYDGIVIAECGSDPDREFGVRGSVAERLSVLEGKGTSKARCLEKIRDSLPPGLRDDELLEFLQKFRKVRNKAVHEGAVVPGTFEEIFEEIVDGRLREFVEGVLL